VTREFEGYGLTEFTTTPGGFVASRVGRAELVEIDVGAVEGIRELHDKLAAALGFPAFYGRNWDAFWDAITGLVRMPRRLVVHGWRNLATRWPGDARIMEACLRDLNAQHPSWRCDYELRW
jgi:ribonuclease inhibitor